MPQYMGFVKKKYSICCGSLVTYRSTICYGKDVNLSPAINSARFPFPTSSTVVSPLYDSSKIA